MGFWCPHKRRKFGHRDVKRTDEAVIGRRQSFISQGGRPRKKPILLTPWSGTSGYRLWENSFLLCKPPSLSHLVMSALASCGFSHLPETRWLTWTSLGRKLKVPSEVLLILSLQPEVSEETRAVGPSDWQNRAGTSLPPSPHHHISAQTANILILFSASSFVSAFIFSPFFSLRSYWSVSNPK